MIKRRYLLGLLSLFLLLNVEAQSFSGAFNENYPIFGFTMLGYSKAPTAKALVTPENFMSATYEKGSMKTTLEKKKIEKGKLTVTLLLEIIEKTSGKKNRVRMQFSIKSDDMAEQNYLTYLRVIDLNSGTSQVVEYDGYSQRSLGQVLGGFSEMIKIFYNIDKLLSN